MRNVPTTLVALFGALILMPAAALATGLSATLSGGSGQDSDGSGFAVVSVTGTTVDYTILVQNIASPTAAHIHTISDGAVFIDLSASFIGNMASGSVSVSSQQAASLVANPSAYAVNVHNAAYPDGAISGILAAADGENVKCIPVIAKLGGKLGTNYVSDVWVGNPGAQPIVLQAEWYPTATTLTGPAATTSVQVPAGGQAEAADAVATLFSASGTRGAVCMRSSAPFVAQARTYNDLRGEGGGTYGQFAEALSMNEALTAGVLYGLSEGPVATAPFRTNLGWFNPTGSVVTVAFTARDADGMAIGSGSVSVPAYGNDITSVSDVIPALAGTTTDSFFVTFSADAAVYVFATVTDNTNGDGIHVPGRPRM